MTSLLLILPSRVSCLDVEDDLKESNCSGSLYAEFLLLSLMKLSFFSTISLCLCPEERMLRADPPDVIRDLVLLKDCSLSSALP